MSTVVEAPKSKTASKAAWKKAKAHTIRVPSGVYIDIQILDLPGLIEAGSIPQNLLDVALSMTDAAADNKLTREQVIEEKAFADLVVLKSVISPELTEEDLPEIPFEDRLMIVEIALRQRDMDAEYNHIGGLHLSASFRRFRQLDGVDEDVADVS